MSVLDMEHSMRVSIPDGVSSSRQSHRISVSLLSDAALSRKFSNSGIFDVART